MKALMNTDHFGLKQVFDFIRGKVRDIYDLGERLLIVSTDRYSAFDVVLPNPIPGRGIILTQMTVKWLKKLEGMFAELSTYLTVQHHIISTSVDDLPKQFTKFADELAGRFMLVHKCIPLPVEFIVRGYISGSLWKAYQAAVKASTEGPITLLGHEFPRDLQESEELAAAIFTPSTKASDGEHDENISYKQMVVILREWLAENGYTNIDAERLAEQCMNVSVKLYSKARDIALEKGIIIADTKLEIGLRFINNEPVLVIIDEVLSPDSSRFWPVDTYEVGKSQPSLDKQPVRDYLDSLDWNKKAPAPELPQSVVDETVERYEKADNMLFAA